MVGRCPHRYPIPPAEARSISRRPAGLRWNYARYRARAVDHSTQRPVAVSTYPFLDSERASYERDVQHISGTGEYLNLVLTIRGSPGCASSRVHRPDR